MYLKKKCLLCPLSDLYKKFKIHGPCLLPTPSYKNISFTIRLYCHERLGFGLKKNLKIKKNNTPVQYSLEAIVFKCTPIDLSSWNKKMYQFTRCKYVIYGCKTTLITNLHLAYFTVVNKQTSNLLFNNEVNIHEYIKNGLAQN